MLRPFSLSVWFAIVPILVLTVRDICGAEDVQQASYFGDHYHKHQSGYDEGHTYDYDGQDNYRSGYKYHGVVGSRIHYWDILQANPFGKVSRKTVPPVVPTCVPAAPFTQFTGVTNALAGVAFEIRNIQTTAIRIDSFDQAMWQAGTSTMEVYTLSGSCDGLMQTPSAWTLVGTGSFIHGFRTVDLLPIPIAVTIQPNAVQSFYITRSDDAGKDVGYRDGSSQYGAVYGSNSDLELIARLGVALKFGSLFGDADGRLWQGVVRYCVLDGSRWLHLHVPGTGKLPIYVNGTNPASNSSGGRRIHVNDTTANSNATCNRNSCSKDCMAAGCAGCAVC